MNRIFGFKSALRLVRAPASVGRTVLTTAGDFRNQTTIAEESAKVYFSRCRSAVLLRRVNDERRPLQHGHPQIPEGRRGDLATRDRNRGARGTRQGTAQRKHVA